MFVSHFYHSLTRKYISLLGTLFNNIEIERDHTGETFKVPLSYGPREKHLARLEGDENISRDIAITLPRISFEMTNMNYSSDRKLSTRNNIVHQEPRSADGKRGSVVTTYQPVPYDLSFDVNIMTKTNEDGYRILEQILPFFTPDWTPTVKLLDDIDRSFDIPVVLLDVAHQDLYDGSFERRRTLLWTLNLKMRCLYFGPVRDSKIIRFANNNIYPQFAQVPEHERLTIQPGKTDANLATIFLQDSMEQAYADAYISNGSVEYVEVTNTGFGYDESSVTLSFSDSPTGDNATGEVIIRDRSIFDVNVTYGGSGYNTAPTVSISQPDHYTVDYHQVEEDDNYDYAIDINTLFEID